MKMRLLDNQLSFKDFSEFSLIALSHPPLSFGEIFLRNLPPTFVSFSDVCATH